MSTGTEQSQLAEGTPEERAALERLYADFAAAHMARCGPSAGT
jgi:ribosomal protein L20A (L18A)